MRIDSGLHGYYYQQGRSQQPTGDAEETAPAAANTPARTSTFSVGIESSTLLSSSLSSALWAIEGGRKNGAASISSGTRANELADTDDFQSIIDRKVSAAYLEYSDAAEDEPAYA